MWFKHIMSIAQQLIPIYNTDVHKNNIFVALNVVKLFVPYVNDTNRPRGPAMLETILTFLLPKAKVYFT